MRPSIHFEGGADRARTLIWIGAIGFALAVLLGMVTFRDESIGQAGLTMSWVDIVAVMRGLSWWLLLALVSATIAGWGLAGLRGRAVNETAMAERDRLLHELVTAAGETGEPGDGGPELDRERDGLRLRADMGAARVTELEHALEAARGRAEEAVGRIAELERAVARADYDKDELAHLRAAHTEAQSREVAVEAETAPAPADAAAAQAWRLRYFEQRVRYLENQAKATAPAGETESADAQALEWRARLAEARLRHLEQEMRLLESAAPLRVHVAEAQRTSPQTEAAAEPTEAEMQPLWRMRYLEARAAHFTAPAVETAPALTSPTEPTPDREAEIAKWRARYLEARVRHLEAKLGEQTLAPVEPAPLSAVAAPSSVAAPAPPPPISAAPSPAVDEEEEEEEVAPTPLVPAGEEVRPLALSAPRDGAPDDLSLIEGVSAMQQSTLNALGVYHFEQIAAWTPANIAWVDQYLRLRGRITRDDWVTQARELTESAQAAEPAL